MRRPTRTEVHRRLFLAAPYGIGIRQGNTALKSWVDSRLNLMRKKDIFQPILKANVAAAVRARVLEEHPPAEQHVHVRGGALRASTPFARSVAVIVRGGGRGGGHFPSLP